MLAKFGCLVITGGLLGQLVVNRGITSAKSLLSLHTPIVKLLQTAASSSGQMPLRFLTAAPAQWAST
jgi:hypothetical protein